MLDFSQLIGKRYRTLGLVAIACIWLLYTFSTHVYKATFSSSGLSRQIGLKSEDAAKFAANAFNNTVVIVPSNKGHMHWVENLLCSLTAVSFDSSRIVFWALDTEAQSILDERGYTTYHDPTLFSTSSNENYRGDTEAYKRMMRERPKFFIDVLSSGFDILMLDADTVFWQSPLSIVPQTTGTPNDADIVYSTDAREFYQDHDAFEDERRRGPYMPPVCNGLFWMKSNPQTISLWTEMLDIFNSYTFRAWYLQRHGFYDDQRGMDVMLNDGRAQIVAPFPDGIVESDVPPRPQKTTRGSGASKNVNVQLLDQTQVVNGQLLMNRPAAYNEYLQRLRQNGKDRIAAHFNWDTKVISKEQGVRVIGLYFIDEDGSCPLSFI